MKRGPITDELAAWLESNVEHPVKPMQGPQTVLSEVFGDTLPYALVEPLDGAQFRDTWGGLWDEGDLPYQVISYGKTGKQAEGLADKVHDAYLDPTIDIVLAGVNVMHRLPAGGADRPEKVGVNLWEVRESFILRVQAS